MILYDKNDLPKTEPLSQEDEETLAYYLGNVPPIGCLRRINLSPLEKHFPIAAMMEKI